VTLVPARWLDGHHVAFGRVISRMVRRKTQARLFLTTILFSQDFTYELSELETFKGTSIPKKYIVINDCGLNDISKYELTYEQLDSYADLVSSI